MALNRCLARHCRLCGEALPAGWAQALWARDVGPGARVEPSLADPVHADRVLRLNDYLRCDSWDLRPLPFQEAGGRLWVAGPDGGQLLIDTFCDRNQRPPMVVPGPARRGPVRARAGGVWLLVGSVAGVHAVNLLAVDGSVGDQNPATNLWESGPGERLVGNPALLCDSQNGLERLAVWLTDGPEGLALWAAPLLVTHGRQPAPRRFALDRPHTVVSPGDSPAALVEAGRDMLLLGTQRGLWLLDVSRLGPPDAPRELHAVPLTDEGPLLAASHGAHHVVFLSHDGPAEAALGTAFVAGAAGSASAGPLWCVPFTAAGPLVCFTAREEGCVPFAVVEARGTRQVLALSKNRSALVLCDALGGIRRVAGGEHLYWASRVTAHGRIAICSGREATDGRARWFVELLDLEQDDTLLDRAFTPRLAAHPLLLGRHLFAIESFEGKEGGLWLTRRSIVNSH